MCVGMCALSSGFNCLIRAYSQLHGYSHDTNTQSAGQWRTWSRAVATQNTGRGDTNHGNRRRKTQCVATRNHWPRRRKTQAEATLITKRGDAKHRQWRRKPRAVATQNTDSVDAKHRQWRQEITGRGDAKHRQWRNTIYAVARQNTGSGDTKHRIECVSEVLQMVDQVLYTAE